MNKKLLYPIEKYLDKSKTDKKIESIIKQVIDILKNKEVDKIKFIEQLELLEKEIKLLVNYILSIDSSLNSKVEHDLRNKETIVTTLNMLQFIDARKQSANLLKNGFNSFLYFLESLYIYTAEDKIAKEFIRNNQINYKLKELMDFLKHNFKKLKINLNININTNIIIKGLKGDFYIFLENIIKNSIKRGKATKVDIYTKKDGENTYLYIADDGSGIDNSVFKNPNDVLKLGNSGNGSSGLGLSNLDKRDIECTVSNNGLKSRFKNLEEVKQQNSHFKGGFNPKGTLIKIKLKTQKAE